ncbi:fibronectin type III domain-containing protein [Micromonospora sp. M12]
MRAGGNADRRRRHPAYAAADTERPTAPGPITVVAVDTTWVELTWAASTDNVGVVRYPVGAQFEDTGAQYSTDTASIRITGLRPSRTYTFSVRAEDAAGNSSLSNPTVRLTMPPGTTKCRARRANRSRTTSPPRWCGSAGRPRWRTSPSNGTRCSGSMPAARSPGSASCTSTRPAAPAPRSAG